MSFTEGLNKEVKSLVKSVALDRIDLYVKQFIVV